MIESQVLLIQIILIGCVFGIGFFFIMRLKRAPVANENLTAVDGTGMTIILVCKDQADYLEFMMRRVLSLMEECFFHLQPQLILVDGGSEDETSRVAECIARSCDFVQSVRSARQEKERSMPLVRAQELAAHRVIITFHVRDSSDWEVVTQWLCALGRAHEDDLQSDPTGNEEGESQ